MRNEPIRVLVVDGDPQVGRALVRLLGPADDIEVVATAVDQQEALALAMKLRPVVAVVDVGTARLDGIEVNRNLGQQATTTRVVMLSVYATFRSQALAAGACRFLLKDCTRDELVAAIRLAARRQCQANGEEQPG